MTENEVFCENMKIALDLNPGASPDQILKDLRRYLPHDLVSMGEHVIDERVDYDSDGSTFCEREIYITPNHTVTSHQYNTAFKFYFRVRNKK